MSLSTSGDQIAIAYGNNVGVVHGPLREKWGAVSVVPIPKVEDGPPHPLVRDIHIVGDVIIVAFFFPELGIM